MTELSYYWPGTVTGDATLAPYDDAEFGLLMSTLLADNTRQGVLPKYLNKLLVTNPVGTTVRVASGAAIVYDKLYVSTGNVDFAAGVAGGYYTVVVAKDWVAQTVRLSILGPNMVTYPTPTQTAGVLWEVPVARVKNTVGVLAIYNSRIMVNAPFGCKVTNDNGDTQVIPNAADTAINWNIVDWDEASMFDVTTPSRITAKLAGRYIITANQGLGNNGVGSRYIRLVVNASATPEASVGDEMYAGGSAGISLSVTAVVNLAVGDYVEVHVYQSSGGNLTIGGWSHFTAVYDG